MEPGYFLPPLRFDADELDAIMLGTRLIAARGDRELRDAARRVRAKVSAVMEGEAGDAYLRSPLRAVSRHVQKGTSVDTHLGLLRDSVRNRALLDIQYLDLREARSRRIARPLGLTVFDDIWLLTIWCETKNDFRNLRVDRIEAVERTGSRFRPERGKLFEDYLKTLP